MSFNDVAIAYVKGNAYRIQFWYMSEDDAISIMNNSNLFDKKRRFLIFFSALSFDLWFDLSSKKQRRDTK